MNRQQIRHPERYARIVGFTPSPRTSPNWNIIAMKEQAKRGKRITVELHDDRERGGPCEKCGRPFATGSGRDNHMVNYHAA